MKTIEISIGNNWNDISQIVQNIYIELSLVVLNKPYLESICGSIRELVENVVKYSTTHQGILQIDIDTNTIHVTTKNPIDKKHYTIIQEELVGLDSPESIEEEFILRIIAAASISKDENISRMGLVRIASETLANISASMTNNILQVNCNFQMQYQEELNI